MALVPSPRSWPSLLGCVLIGLAAVILPGCGSEGGAAAERTDAPPAKQQGEVEAARAEPCPAQVRAFAKSLDGMRHQLAIGLSYDQYAGRVKSLRRGYDDIPIDHLTIGCLRTTGTPAEAALNKYIDAANAWGQCLADSSCTTEAIEPVLQRKWRVASHSLSEAA
jgi:hypothetical protein